MKTNKKNIYIVPSVSFIRLTTLNMVVASHAQSINEEVFEKTRQEGWTFQRCPFNNKWCYDKQIRFNEWRKAVEYFAENHIDMNIYTNSDMFNECPHGYNALYESCKQKQRG